ncbi:MAG: hypothetical protein WC483_00455 [Candidatus Paceibacterota bacterium]
MPPSLWIGVAIACAIIIVCLLVWCCGCWRSSSSTTSSSTVSPFKPITNYVANISSDQKTVIHRLVVEAAPRLQGQRFSLSDVRAIIGEDPALDQVMYFHFRHLLKEGRLTEANMVKALSTGY